MELCWDLLGREMTRFEKSDERIEKGKAKN
jgi:hypothetical protein